MKLTCVKSNGSVHMTMARQANHSRTFAFPIVIPNVNLLRESIDIIYCITYIIFLAFCSNHQLKIPSVEFLAYVVSPTFRVGKFEFAWKANIIERSRVIALLVECAISSERACPLGNARCLGRVRGVLERLLSSRGLRCFCR